MKKVNKFALVAIGLALLVFVSSTWYWKQLWSHSEPVKSSSALWDYQVTNHSEAYSLSGNFRREFPEYLIVAISAIYSGTDIRMGNAVADWANLAPGWRDARFAVYVRSANSKFYRTYHKLQNLWLSVKYGLPKKQ